MQYDDFEMPSSSSLLWDLFRETGEIGYYLLYKQLKGEI